MLDPACGSGNFLYLALKSLKDIEARVNIEAESLGLQPQLPSVGPECVRGIEINPFAAELARVSVWIGEIQWMREKGFGVSKNPILKSLESIECRDALLNPDGCEAEWPEADVIIGNPPFVAARDMVPELGQKYVNLIKDAFEHSIDGGVDFVCYWFVKAGNLIAGSKVDRVGLVCTNSVPRSVSRKAVDFVVQKAHLYFAIRNLLWNTSPSGEGSGKLASVRISILCFDRLEPLSFTLDGREVRGISTDLYERLPSTKFSQAEIHTLAENKDLAFQGIVPRSEVNPKAKLKLGLPDASFVISGDQARRLLLTLGNPNRRPNSDVIRRFVVAEDLTDRDEGRFILDFGNKPEAVASGYAAPFALIGNVRLHRAAMEQDDALRTWWQFWRSRTDNRKKLSSVKRYIATPRSAKHRMFVFVDARMVPDNAVVWFASDSVTLFGILHSRIHEVWTRRQCSYQGVADTPRYKHTDVFETFPLPPCMLAVRPAKPSTREALGIARAAGKLNWKRENWLNPPDLVQRVPEVVPGYPDRIQPVDDKAAKILKDRTLTKLYNERPAWLDHAHKDLDKAVADAYGWPADLSDDEILERLFMLNQDRAAKQ